VVTLTNFSNGNRAAQGSSQDFMARVAKVNISQQSSAARIMRTVTATTKHKTPWLEQAVRTPRWRLRTKASGLPRT